MTHLSPTTNPNAARDDDDHIIVVPPEDRTIVVPPPGPDDCIVALPDGSRWWVSLPPPVRELLPHALRAEDACKPLSSVAKQRCRQRKPLPSNGLLTAAQAAARLNCSIKTLNGHVASGALRYVALGHGCKRVRRMFADADLNEFIANQTRKDVPCPSTASRAALTGTVNSESKVIAFTLVPKPRPGAKRRK